MTSLRKIQTTNKIHWYTYPWMTWNREWCVEPQFSISEIFNWTQHTYLCISSHNIFHARLITQPLQMTQSFPYRKMTWQERYVPLWLHVFIHSWGSAIAFARQNTSGVERLIQPFNVLLYSSGFFLYSLGLLFLQWSRKWGACNVRHCTGLKLAPGLTNSWLRKQSNQIYW